MVSTARITADIAQQQLDRFCAARGARTMTVISYIVEITGHEGPFDWDPSRLSPAALASRPSGTDTVSAFTEEERA